MPDYITKNLENNVTISTYSGGGAFGELLDGIIGELSDKKELFKKIRKDAELLLKNPPVAEKRFFSSEETKKFSETSDYYSGFSKLLTELNENIITTSFSAPLFFKNAEKILLKGAYYLVDRTNIRMSEDSTGLSNIYYSLFSLLNILMKHLSESKVVDVQEIESVCQVISKHIDSLCIKYDRMTGNRIPFLREIQGEFLRDIVSFANYRNEHVSFSDYVGDLDSRLQKSSALMMSLAVSVSQTTEADAEIKASENRKLAILRADLDDVYNQINDEALHDVKLLIEHLTKKQKVSESDHKTSQPMPIKKEGISVNFAEELKEEIAHSYKNHFVSTLDRRFGLESKEESELFTSQDLSKSMSVLEKSHQSITQKEPLKLSEFDIIKDSKHKKAEVSLKNRRQTGLKEQKSKVIDRRLVQYNDLVEEVYKLKVRRLFKANNYLEKNFLKQAEDYLVLVFKKRHQHETNSEYLRVFSTDDLQKQNKINKALIKALQIQIALEECLTSINVLTQQRGCVWWAKNQKNNLAIVSQLIVKAKADIHNLLSKDPLIDKSIANTPVIGILEAKLKELQGQFPSTQLSNFDHNVNAINASEEELQSALNNFYSATGDLAEILGENVDIDKNMASRPLSWTDTKSLEEDFNRIHEQSLASQMLLMDAKKYLEKVSTELSGLQLLKVKLEHLNGEQKNKIEELQEISIRLKGDLSQARLEVENLKKQIQGKNEAEDQFLSGLLDLLEKKLKGFEEKQRTITEVQDKISNLSKRLLDHKESQGNNLELFNEIIDVMGSASGLIENYRTLLDDMKEISNKVKTYADNPDRAGRNDEINNKLLVIDGLIQSGTEKADAFDKVIGSLKEQLKWYKKYTEELKKQIGSLKETINDLKDQNDKLQRQLEEQSKKSEESKKRHELQTTKQIEMLQTQLNEKKSEYEKLQELSKNAQKKVELLEVQLEKKNQKVGNLENGIQQKEKELQVLKDSDKSNKGKILRTEVEIEALKKDKEQLNEKFKKQLEVKDLEVSELRQKVERRQPETQQMDDLKIQLNQSEKENLLRSITMASHKKVSWTFFGGGKNLDAKYVDIDPGKVTTKVANALNSEKIKTSFTDDDFATFKKKLVKAINEAEGGKGGRQDATTAFYNEIGQLAQSENQDIDLSGACSRYNRSA